MHTHQLAAEGLLVSNSTIDSAFPGESAVQRLHDELAIRQLIADRAYALDEQDAEGIGALFVESGVIETFFPGEEGAHVIFDTRKGIIEGMLRYFAEAHSGLLTRTHFSSVRMDAINQNSAKARGIYLITAQTPEREAPVPLISGVVEWQFERTSAGWRFSRASGYQDQRRWLDRPWPP
jgi:hypothetical protein